MSKFLKYETVCPVCGKMIKGRRLQSYFSTGPADLDTNPHNSAVYDMVQICPHCGFTSENMFEKADDAVKRIVYSDSYQELWKRDDISERSKKMLLFSQIAELRGESKRAAFAVLRAYWDGLEIGKKNTSLLEKAENFYIDYLTKHQDVDAAMILIDIERQMGSFAEAEETALSLMPYLDDSYRKAVVQLELELIAQRDDTTHSQNEVTFG